MSRLILTAQTLQQKSVGLFRGVRAAKTAYVKPTVNISVKISFCSLPVRNFHSNGIGFVLPSAQNKEHSRLRTHQGQEREIGNCIDRSADKIKELNIDAMTL